MLDPGAAIGHNMQVGRLRSRINSALGLTAQGFKDQCELPAADPAPAGPVATRGRGD